MLRPALLAGVLRAVAHNAAHGNPDVAIFELGRVFAPPLAGQTLPVERLHLAAARSGRIVQTPYEADRDVTVHDHDCGGRGRSRRSSGSPTGSFRRRPFRACTRCGARTWWSAARSSVPSGRSTATCSTPSRCPGRSSPLRSTDVDVAAARQARGSARTSHPVSRFPASAIDLAFVVSDDVRPRRRRRADVARSRWRGARIRPGLRRLPIRTRSGAGRVSLAFALTFRRRGSHADRRRGRTAPEGLHRRGAGRARSATPRLARMAIPGRPITRFGRDERGCRCRAQSWSRPSTTVAGSRDQRRRVGRRLAFRRTQQRGAHGPDRRCRWRSRRSVRGPDARA